MKNLIYYFVLITISSFGQISQTEFDKSIKLNNGNNIAAATNNINALQTKFPNDAKVFFLKGMLNFIQKDYNQSLINLSKSINLNPKFTKAYVARSTTYATLENFDKAIIDQSKALSLEPKNLDFLSNRAYFYSENKQYAASLEDVKSKIKIDPNNTTNYLQAAIISRKMDVSFNADVFFEQALLVKTINKNKLEKFYAEFLLNNGRYQESEIKYKNALATNEKLFSGVDYQNLAIASEKLQNYEASIGYYKNAISKSPSNVLVYNNLSSVYILMKRWLELKDNADATLIVSPNDAVANKYMSIALNRTGNQNLAIQYEAKSKEFDDNKAK